MAKGPAMSRDEAIKAIEVGMEVTDQLVKEAIICWEPEKWASEIPVPAVPC